MYDIFHFLFKEGETSVVKEASGTPRWTAELPMRHPVDGAFEMMHNTSKDSSYFLDTMSEEEQLAVALRLSKVECEAANSQSNRSLHIDKAGAQDYSGKLCTPRTKLRACSSLSTETNFVDNEQLFSNEDSELEAAPKQSVQAAKKKLYLEQYGHAITDNKGSVDADLERALELSSIEYESSRFTNGRSSLSRNGEHSVVKNKVGPYATVLTSTENNEDDDLSKALQLSIEENEHKGQRWETCSSDSKFSRGDGICSGVEENQQETNQYTDNVRKHELSRSIKNSTMKLNKDYIGTTPANSSRMEDEDMEKALMLSRMEYERFGAVVLGGTVQENDTNKQTHCSNKLKHSNDYSTLKALEQNNTCHQQGKGCAGMDSLQETEEDCPVSDREKVTQSLDNTTRCDLVGTMETSDVTSSSELNKGSWLDRALEVSRVEYDQCKLGAVMDQNLNATGDTDVVVVEEYFADKTTDYASCSPRKPFLVNEASDDEFAPSSLASEWKCSQERGTTFKALNHVQSSGRSKHCPISIDSQDDDILEVQEAELETFAQDNRRLSSSMEENTAIDDFAFALRLEKELNKESRPSANETDQTHNTFSASGLTEQLSSYRQLQKQKYSSLSGKKDKSSPGLEFRRNVAAVACGKPVNVGVARPMSRPGHSQNVQEPVRLVQHKQPSAVSVNF